MKHKTLNGGFVSKKSLTQLSVCARSRGLLRVCLLTAAASRLRSGGLVAMAALLLTCGHLHASIAYGSINNFDTVNDTGVPTHGFEIELDDIQSADITYTYDWNHYGTPSIREDIASVPGHTNVFVRYAAILTNGVWSAYTAVPSGPIAPTLGHQFTNPGTNFGGEHFGVGYIRPASSVKYNWLIDGGGALVQGPPVNVATPTFTYYPPVGGLPGQVQAVIGPPPPPVLPRIRFGAAEWVKEIRTSTHNAKEVKLRNLVSKDPAYPNDKDWRNGEPDEVESEWQLLQFDYKKPGGGSNAELKASPENLRNGNEVITRRYEFFEYVGPLDPASGEALAAAVGADGIHGTNGYEATVVVGKFLGAQMSAVHVVLPLGLIDHLPDGEVNTPYPTRSVVIAIETNFTVKTTGALPDGLAFDAPTGRVYGTPRTSGVFTFHVEASAATNPVVAKTFIFTIAASGVILPPHSSVDTSEFPLRSGVSSGLGVYTNGALATLTATPAAGFGFVNWTDDGTPVSTSATYQFTVDVNRSLVANFAPMPALTIRARQPHSMDIVWPTNFDGYLLQQQSALDSANWVTATNTVTTNGTNYQATVPTSGSLMFLRLIRP